MDRSGPRRRAERGVAIARRSVYRHSPVDPIDFSIGLSNRLGGLLFGLAGPLGVKREPARDTCGAAATLAQKRLLTLYKTRMYRDDALSSS